jgi:hypothetical protein
MTPPRLTELQCPQCRSNHWTLDSDYRGMDGEFVAYRERTYSCPQCHYSGISFTVLQQSPPEFLLQPHPMYPMSERDFYYWLKILEHNFPDHPQLKEFGGEFRPKRKVRSNWLANALRWIRRP